MFMSLSQKHLNIFGCKNRHIVMCPYQYMKTLQHVHLTNYTKVLSPQVEAIRQNHYADGFIKCKHIT